MTDALPARVMPLTDDERIRAACDWSDYRKDYGVEPDPRHRRLEHQAFLAGWAARHQEAGPSTTRTEQDVIHEFLRTQYQPTIKLEAAPGAIALIRAAALTDIRATIADIRRMPGGSSGRSVKGAAGSFRRKAVERMIDWVCSDDFEMALAEVIAERGEGR